jgi:plasmid stabilization system protein ParE
VDGPDVKKIREKSYSRPCPYVAVYRVKEQSIEIMRIYHGAQDRS